MDRFRRGIRACLCLAGGLACIATLAWAAGEVMQVKVEETALRDKPGFLGKPVATLAYEEVVEVLSTQGAWVKVKRNKDGATGWLRASALTTSRVDLRAGSSDAARAASSEEMALAGRGFNREIEQAHRRKNDSSNYNYIDRVEQGYALSEAELVRFLSEGGVLKGGAQ